PPRVWCCRAPVGSEPFFLSVGGARCGATAGILACRSRPALAETALQLRDSAGVARTFPDSSHVFGCPASIGRRLHCAGVRIVSLLPSATEIVCLLGLEDQLVGVSADSDWPVEAVKRQPVLNTVSIDTSQLTSQEIDTAAGD